MREHGVLQRVLLMYEECRRRLGAREPFAPAVLQSAADIIRRFVEEYHEKLEEDFLFPRFERADRLKDLVGIVGILRKQHAAGRGLTENVLRISGAPDLGGSNGRTELSGALQAFIHMYRPHAAREDTVLFPALHRIASPHELWELGEQFEEREEHLFGENGFDHIVEEVADLERQLDIQDLAEFTAG
jgi:hemerythrin-like domain-containing protein